MSLKIWTDTFVSAQQIRQFIVKQNKMENINNEETESNETS